ncbi:MAG: prolipoprotein diacylglyceryl transferase [Chitinophagaceae bacterium]|nr:prolipoprotein diacylglyceryl transferase [Chitinophagaceae bacterium]
MYPNLYYVFKDWFGVEWKPLSFLNTFGFMVAMGFIAAAIVLSSELRRKEKQALLLPREEFITVGKPATFLELLINFITGFLFGYKLIGLVMNKPEDVNPQEYIFSSQGNFVAGTLVGLLLAGLKWWEKEKQKTKEPEQRSVRIWPHDRVGDIIVIGLIFGIIGAKLFDCFENWDDFIEHPIDRLFSAGGLTFYGGLILAAVAICFYGYKKNIRLIHLIDAATPALLIAYAVGRIGCQVSGDGDWGIYNSAYITDANGKSVEAKPGEFESRLTKYQSYFLYGEVQDPGSPRPLRITDRKSESLDKVPHKFVKAPAYLPIWMVAYSYPQNVNKDGIKIESIQDEHNRALPIPVFPTPFYETVVCTLLFLVLWSIRKRIKVAGLMTGIYLVLNGAERFLIEKIRVNNQMYFLGIKLTQAELISCTLAIAGVLIIIFVLLRKQAKE